MAAKPSFPVYTPLSRWRLFLRGIKPLKSQAIFKSIEKLSDSRILDIYLKVLKKEERTTGALETSAGVPLMAISVILF